jgi:hypothetical protein
MYSSSMILKVHVTTKDDFVYQMFELYILMVQLVKILVFFILTSFILTSSILNTNFAIVPLPEFGRAALKF